MRFIHLAFGCLSLGALGFLPGCSSDSDDPKGSGGSGGSGAAGGSGGTHSSGGSGGSGSGAINFRVETHPNQPMIVDIVAEIPDSEAASLELTSDLGVRIVEIPDTSDSERRYRLRGLAPATDYQPELVFGGERHAVEFKTLDPLPGFRAAFPVTTSGTPSGDYRLFDYQDFPEITNAGVFVIDNTGTTRWFFSLPKTDTSFSIAAGVKLLPDGNVLFTQNHHVRIVNELGDDVMRVSKDGLVEREDYLFHHDVIPLPNGNFVVLAMEADWVYYPEDDKELYILGDTLIEFNPEGELVWEWSSFDHLDPLRKRMDFDTIYFPVFPPDDEERNDPSKIALDWTHANGVIYDAKDDSFIMSVRHQDWMIKIDHQSGDIVWRLGDEGDFALQSGSWFFHPHSPELQSDGSLLIYDNGNGNPHVDQADWRTRPVRVSFDETAKTADIAWEDTKETYLAPIAGDVNVMSNGHYLVMDSVLPAWDPASPLKGVPRMREVDPVTGEWVWVLEGLHGGFAYRAVPINRMPGEAQ